MDSEIFKKFRETLNQSLMLDHAELDFGIYRIMNQKREQITRFLDEDLPQLVEKTLTDFIGVDTEDLRRQLAGKESEIRAMGLNPADAIPVKEMRERLKDMPDRRASEGHVYDHLARFLARYYVDGDFMPIRRYRSGDTYAIPYDGEEVKLYWANADQYYIKTAEHFRHYAFHTPDGRRVEFTLREASTEQNNNKEEKGKERRFKLVEDSPVEIVDGALHIYFTYEPMPKAVKQKALVEQALQTLATCLPADYACLLAPYKTDDKRTLLEKHLTDYVSRNTFDYFIHKDLHGFLSRELDFYIKNEMLVIDDIDSRDSRQFLGLLAEAKAVKVIGGKIIDFLAQIEDFQKRLWLKRKFVTQADYCITLDRIPAELYPEICANDWQREEWVRLFAINEIKGDLLSPGYSEPLTTAFLEANPHLVLDTALFAADFKHRLLTAVPHIDEQCDGLLINSENFQALRLIEEKYRGKVKCIYIDPPYNTNSSAIMYKNGYRDSSWLSLMSDRLVLGKGLLLPKGIHCTAIDDVEEPKLSLVLERIFEESPMVVAHRVKPSGRPIPNGFAISHDYALFNRNSEQAAIARLPRDDEREARYKEEDEKGRFFYEMLRKAGSNSDRANRPTMFYPIYWDEGQNQFRLPNMEYDEESKSYIVYEKPKQGERALYPIKDDGTEGRWYYGVENVEERLDGLKVEKQPSGIYYVYYRRRPNVGIQPTTLWYDAKYSATEHGTALLKKMFGKQEVFSYPKSIYGVEDCLKVAGVKSGSLVLDYFAGSATTGHAVINLNRQEKDKSEPRKYILVEMGAYFNTVTKPRIEKVIYSQDWRKGKPVDRQGVSHCFKYLRLEQYEDTLNNLLLPKRTDDEGLFAGQFRTDYTLGYLLDVEMRGSLLSMEWFEHPFDVTMKITRGSETVKQGVDLVETFNYLIGLTVDTMEWPQEGLCVVQGTMRQGGKAAIVWRDKDKVSEEKLTAFLTGRKWNAGRLYLNGDTAATAELCRSLAAKVMSIEEEFSSRMFDEED